VFSLALCFWECLQYRHVAYIVPDSRQTSMTSPYRAVCLMCREAYRPVTRSYEDRGRIRFSAACAAFWNKVWRASSLSSPVIITRRSITAARRGTVALTAPRGLHRALIVINEHSDTADRTPSATDHHSCDVVTSTKSLCCRTASKRRWPVSQTSPASRDSSKLQSGRYANAEA